LDLREVLDGDARTGIERFEVTSTRPENANETSDAEIAPNAAGKEKILEAIKPLDAPSHSHNSSTAGAIRSSTTNSKSLSISLTSLHSMHYPKITSVLYASPQDPTDRLLPLCEKLRSLFQKEGYLVPDDRPLKLHATIVNTIHAKSGARGSLVPRFDAEPLLEAWKDFVWATDVPLERVAICKMGAKKVLNEEGAVVGEEYEEIASIPFLL